MRWDKGGSRQGWTGSGGFVQQVDFVLRIMGCTGQVKPKNDAWEAHVKKLTLGQRSV